MFKMEFAMPEPQSQLLRKPYEKRRDHRHKKRTNSENSLTTIEDSLKAIYLKDNEVNNKAHVSILQEVLNRYGATPNYELIGIEAIGVGKTKKEARHSAAKAIIDKLTGVCEMTTASTLDNNFDDLDSSLRNNGFGNPTGWLQELCTARHWPPPLYETDFVSGKPHDCQFQIACIVSKYREVGQGKTKKAAKLLAAHKTWTLIQKEIYAKSKANQDLEDVGLFEISHVRTNVIDYSQHLQEIADVNKFDVKYKNFEEKTVAGCFQCLVQLTTVPKIHCHGTGASRKVAQLNAARSAVKYLQALSSSLVNT